VNASVFFLGFFWCTCFTKLKKYDVFFCFKLLLLRGFFFLENNCFKLLFPKIRFLCKIILPRNKDKFLLFFFLNGIKSLYFHHFNALSCLRKLILVCLFTFVEFRFTLCDENGIFRLYLFLNSNLMFSLFTTCFGVKVLAGFKSNEYSEACFPMITKRLLYHWV
jgi:hypothetical protein